MRRMVAVLAVLGFAAAVGRVAERTADEVPTIAVTTTRFVRRVTADGTLRAVAATPIAVPQIDGLWGPLEIAWLAQDGRAVKRGDVIVRFVRGEAEKQLRDARAELISLDAQLREARIKAAASDADHAATAALAKQQAEEARELQAVDPLLFSRNQMIESELDEKLAIARQRHAERARDLDAGMTRSDLALAALARDRAALAVHHAETAVGSLELRAPNDGVLVLHRDDRGEVPKLGARVYANETLAEIPAPGAMEAELFVLEVDGSGLDVGQRATIVVEARPDLKFHGSVRFVDKLAKPRQAGSPVQYFAALVALDTSDPAVMKPSSRVRATLVLADREAIVVPRHAVFERNGTAVVYRRDAAGFTPVAVELGAATSGRVAVSGLADGDAIALREPGSTQ